MAHSVMAVFVVAANQMLNVVVILHSAMKLMESV